MATATATVAIPRGMKLRRTLAGHEGQIFRMAWSPDGKFLATPSADRTVRIWEVATGEEWRTLKGHMSAVWSVAWSADGKRLASVSEDKSLRVWDVETGENVRTHRGPWSSFITVCWPSNEVTLLSGMDDGRIWAYDSRSFLSQQSVKRHSNVIHCVTASPDGKYFISGGSRTIRLWDTKLRFDRGKLEGHTSRVLSVDWSRDGRLIASSSLDKTVRLWDPKTLKCTGVLEGHRGAVTCVSISSGGDVIASKSLDHTVKMWRVDTQAEVASFHEDCGNSMFPGLAFHPSAPLLATADLSSRYVQIWELDHDLLLGYLVSTDEVEDSIGFADWVGASKATLAIVFTDIVGSTDLNNELGNDAMRDVRRAHFEHARYLIKKTRGFEIKTIGDAFVVAFKSSADAIDFAVALYHETGHDRVQIRAGVHVGPVDIAEEDVWGATVNFSARVQSMGKGAEIWVSNRAKQDIDIEAAKHHQLLQWAEHSDCELKGFSGKHTLWSMTVPESLVI